jgi:ABC-type maltose transport system permease subunit
MFNIFKVLEIKYTYENKLNALMLNSVWINLVSLASVYFSLDRLFEGDWLVVPFYIGGSVIGKWIAMTQADTIRKSFVTFLNKKSYKD